MKTNFLFLLLAILLCQWSNANTQQSVSSGKLIEYPKFKSSIISPRDVFVWLPSDYSEKKNVKFISLASGSSGNCYFFSNGVVSFVIDFGIGLRTARKRLAEYNMNGELTKL
mgnify:CR=1 FL=1